MVPGSRIIGTAEGYCVEIWVISLRCYRKVRLEIVKCSDQSKGFIVLPKGWIVERTFGWFGKC